MSTDDLHPSSSAAADVRRPRRAPVAGPFVLALVGPAGAGKSTIARALAERGARIVDGDRLGHEVTDHDPEVRAALIATVQVAHRRQRVRPRTEEIGRAHV